MIDDGWKDGVTLIFVVLAVSWAVIVLTIEIAERPTRQKKMSGQMIVQVVNNQKVLWHLKCL